MEDTQGNASGGDPFASAAKLKPGTKRPLPPRTAAAIRSDQAANGDPFSPRKRLKRTPPKGTPPVLDTVGHGSAGTATGPRVLNFAAMTASATNHQQEQQQQEDPSMSPPSSPTTNSNSSPTRRPRPAASKPAPSLSSSSVSALRPPFHSPARQPLLHRTPAGKPAAAATPHPAPRTSTPSRSLATPARPVPATPLTAHHTHARQGQGQAQAFTPATGRPGAAFASLDTVSAGTSSALAGGQAALSFTPRRNTLHQPHMARKNIVPAQRRLTSLAPPDARALHTPAPVAGAAPARPKGAEIGIHRHFRLESMPGGRAEVVDCGHVTAKVSFAHAGESREDGQSVPDYVLDFGRSVVFGEFEGCT